jgi:hypothetical protein
MKNRQTGKRLSTKKKKTKEDKEFDEAEVESTGGGFDAGGG